VAAIKGAASDSVSRIFGIALRARDGGFVHIYIPRIVRHERNCHRSTGGASIRYWGVRAQYPIPNVFDLFVEYFFWVKLNRR
jgi:hypothetical protein